MNKLPNGITKQQCTATSLDTPKKLSKNLLFFMVIISALVCKKVGAKIKRFLD